MANKLILCEGKTDAILLSYYLGKMYGWSYVPAGPDGLKIKATDNNSEINWYMRGNDMLLICSVGGKNNFGSFFREKISSPIAKTDNAFESMAAITDRDKNSIKDIEEYMSAEFAPFIHEMKNRKWCENSYSDGFNIVNKIKSLLLIIPEKDEGALETVLLDAMSENDYDAKIIEQVKQFVGSIRPHAKRYISSNRKELKAKFGVTLAVKYPEKVFSLIDEQLRNITWEKYSVLQDCFGVLAEL